MEAVTLAIDGLAHAAEARAPPAEPAERALESKTLMRVAALYDIHGNLPALEAVLDEVNRAAVDEIVVGGDVFPGPMANEALACLLELDVPVRFIRGNGDRAVLALASGEETEAIPEQHRASVQWVARQLSPEYQRLIERWPATVRLVLPGLGHVLFCHATPRSDTEIFTRKTSANRLVPIFEGLGAGIVVCGHTHMPFDRRIGTVRVVNAGSVGMPFGTPHAHWLLLGSHLEMCETRYDLVDAAERIRASAYPGAREFAARNVLHPPAEHEMLQLFARSELR